MGDRRKSFWAALLTTSVFVGCETQPTEPRLDPSSAVPRLSIEDAVHNGGNQHFFWLPPMVSSPAHAGTFDGGLTPVVEICEWDGTGCVLPLVARFTTTSGPDSETVRVVPEEEHYIVNWHTDQFGLDASRTYRILAQVDGRELGHADVDVVSNGSQLKNVDTDEYIPLKDGRTLPIKFRIEEGALPSEITIDATALSAPSVDLRGPGGPIGFLPSNVVITLPNEPGAYSISDRFNLYPVPFSVTPAGLVDFDPAYDQILSGRGTSLLRVVGHEYVVDATPLTGPNILLGGVGVFSRSTPLSLRELPGVKNVQELGGGLAFYELALDGSVTYAVEAEPYLDGQGSTTLQVVGYPYTVDASGLSVANIVLSAIGGFPSAVPVNVRGLPGSKNVIDPSGGALPFQLAADGTIGLGPQSDQVADGAGTTTLTLVGAQFHVDARLASVSSFFLGGLTSMPTASVHSFSLLPGSKTYQSSALTFAFTVDHAGNVDFAAALDPQVSGRGTSTLTILN